MNNVPLLAFDGVLSPLELIIVFLILAIALAGWAPHRVENCTKKGYRWWHTLFLIKH